MQTPDAEWRVEVVRRGSARWYRIVHGDNELDWLSIAAVERILAESGVDMAQLEAAGEPPAGAVDRADHGAA